MTPGLRKFTFTTHITSSLGWIGAVIVFLALAIIALTSPDERVVRGTYLVMSPAAWFVLVPLAHASLLSGVALSLGTSWGLFRHYWVVLKLGITVFCTVILLIYMGTFRQMAGLAGDPVVDLSLVRSASPAVHAMLALVLLLVAAVLGVYKPFGTTGYGTRKQDERREAVVPSRAPTLSRSAVDASSTPRWMYLSVVAAIGIVLLILLLHFSGHTFRH